MNLPFSVNKNGVVFAAIIILLFSGKPLALAQESFSDSARMQAAPQAPTETPAAATPAPASKPAAATPSGAATILTSAPSALPAFPEMPPKISDSTSAGQENKPAPYRGPVTSTPKPIKINRSAETLDERFERMITLDVREMNVLDVLKFLALKGDFNMVTGNQVAGRVTLYLKNVKLKDALEIIVISNNLAYYVERDIVNILSEAEYVALFGKRFNDKLAVEILHINYAKPAYVLTTLESVKSALGKIIIDQETGSLVLIDTPEGLAKMRKALKEIESPSEPLVYNVQYAKVDILAEKLRSRVDASSVGSITVDERSNKLIVTSLPGRKLEIEKMIKALDAPTKEVLIEVRVLQVTFKPQMDFGIDWSKDFKSSTNPFLKKLSFQNVASNSNANTFFGKIAYGNINVDDFELTIRALKQVADTRILSNPRLLVTNEEEAMIHVGDTVPYIISTTSGTGENAITSEDVRFVDVGVKINVTPKINEDGFVTMRLKPEISTYSIGVNSKGGGIPQVNKTLLETTIMVKDGMTIVLGGLKKESKTQTRKGVPVLMDIPYVRGLFSSNSESVEATEIVIFITPHVVRGDEDFTKYRGEIKPDQNLSGPKAKEAVPAVSKPEKPQGLQLKD